MVWRRGGRWAASRGRSEALRGWESTAEGLRLSAGAKAATRPGLFTSAETASWSPRAEHFPSRGEAGRPGECECLETNWCVRAVVLTALPPYPPLSRQRLQPQLRAFWDPPAATPRPLRTQCGAVAPEGEPWRAHPDLPDQAGDPAYVRRQLIKSPLPASRPERRALAPSVVLPPLPDRARCYVWCCPWSCRFCLNSGPRGEKVYQGTFLATPTHVLLEVVWMPGASPQVLAFRTCSKSRV